MMLKSILLNVLDLNNSQNISERAAIKKREYITLGLKQSHKSNSH